MRIYQLAFLLMLSVKGIFCAQQSDIASDPAHVPDTFKELERAQKARAREQALQTTAKEKYFVDSFNRLAAAMEDFSKTYKVTHTVDANQVKLIREAYRNLERADPWFRNKKD